MRTLNGPHSSPRPACAAPPSPPIPHCSSQLSAQVEFKQNEKKGGEEDVRSEIKLVVFQPQGLACFNTRNAGKELPAPADVPKDSFSSPSPSSSLQKQWWSCGGRCQSMCSVQGRRWSADPLPPLLRGRGTDVREQKFPRERRADSARVSALHREKALRDSPSV